MKELKIPIGWVVPLIGLALLIGILLDRAGWQIGGISIPPVEVVPPTVTSVRGQQRLTPSLSTPPQQRGVNCNFINELIAKADVIQTLYEGEEIAGVQVRLLQGVDVPAGWIIHKDGREYLGPIHFDAGIVASFWSPVSCRPLNIGE